MEYTDASNRNNRYDGLQKLIREFLGEAESEDEEDAAEDPADEEETLMMDSAEVIRTLPEEPVAPILAPKRVVLGPLGASDKINSGKADFNPFKKSETCKFSQQMDAHLLLRRVILMRTHKMHL